MDEGGERFGAWPAVAAAVLARAVPPAVAWVGHGADALRTADSPAYLEAAQSLWSRGRYAGPHGPEILRPPAYSAFLAPGVALGAPEAYAAVTQALLGGLTVLLVYEAARRLCQDRRAGLLAAWLVALDPTHLAWSGRVMAEALFTAVVALALLALVATHRTGARVWLAVLTVAAGLAAYVRFVGIALPALAAAGLVVAAAPGRQRAAITRAAVVVLGGLLLLLPWCVRNGLAAGYWGFSSYPDRYLAFSMVPALEARGDPGSLQARRARARAGLHDPGGDDGEAHRGRRASALGRLLEHPLDGARVHLAGSVRTLFLPGALSLREAFGPLDGSERTVSADMLEHGAARAWASARAELRLESAALVLAQLPLALGVLLSARAAWGGAREVLLLGVPLLGFALVSGGPWGQSRLRHPLVPFLAVLAARGATGASRQAQSR